MQNLLDLDIDSEFENTMRTLAGDKNGAPLSTYQRQYEEPPIQVTFLSLEDSLADAPHNPNKQPDDELPLAEMTMMT